MSVWEWCLSTPEDYETNGFCGIQQRNLTEGSGPNLVWCLSHSCRESSVFLASCLCFWGSKEQGISQFLLLNSVSRLQFHQSHTPELFTECLSQTELATGSQVGHGNMAPGSAQPPHYGKSPALFEARPAQAHASQGGPSLYTDQRLKTVHFCHGWRTEQVRYFAPTVMKSTTSSCPVFSPLRLCRLHMEVPQSLSEFTGLCCPCRQTFKCSAIRTCGRPISRHAQGPRSDTNKSTSKRKIQKTDENWFQRFDGCSQLQLCSSSLSPLKAQAFATLSSNCRCNAGQGEWQTCGKTPGAQIGKWHHWHHWHSKSVKLHKAQEANFEASTNHALLLQDFLTWGSRKCTTFTTVHLQPMYISVQTLTPLHNTTSRGRAWWCMAVSKCAVQDAQELQ